MFPRSRRQLNNITSYTQEITMHTLHIRETDASVDERGRSRRTRSRAWHLHENETKVNENESKGVQFPAAEMPLIKLIGAANRQSPVIAWKCLPLVPQEHQIRMRSDERDKLSHFVITRVTLCNKLEMDGRRTSKPKNKGAFHSIQNRTNFEGGPLLPVWSFRSVGPKYPFPFDKIVVPSTALFILLTRTITKRAVAWVGSVQSYCAVPLGSWNFCWMESALSITIDNNNNNKTATTLTQISLITLMIIENRALWLARNARWL